MKKILFSLIVLSLFASCSLNEKQPNILERPTAIQSVDDAVKVANYLNLYIRSLSAGTRIYYSEVAADGFHPSINYGNRIGTQFRWQWNSTNGDFGRWGTCYEAIGQACWLIEEAAKFDQSTLTSDEIKALNEAVGLAYFTKAFMGHLLVQYYCKPYSATASTDYGIMCVDILQKEPSDITAYPGRSNLEDSYQWILANLSQAETLLANVTNKVGSTVVTPDVITALQARIALLMGDYDTAITKSTSLIDSGTYPLIETTTTTNANGQQVTVTAQSKMTSLWTNDSGEECIMQMYATSQSQPSTYDAGYYSYSTSTRLYTPDWILSSGYVSLFDSGDLRYTTWIAPNIYCTYSTAEGRATLLHKFPSNLSLQASQSSYSYLQKPKPFRIAEQYLIAAEAYARKGNNDGAAYQYLFDLQSKRIPGALSNPVTGDELLAAIKLERQKEFIGEGFRWLDLKRYGEGFTRTAPQNPAITSTGGADGTAGTMTVEASNYRWLMPIPQDEIDANPQIRAQQNPGY